MHTFLVTFAYIYNDFRKICENITQGNLLPNIDHDKKEIKKRSITIK